MYIISLDRINDFFRLTIKDNNNNLLRDVSLIRGIEYIVHPLNPNTQNKRGRKVIFKDIENTNQGPKAKVQYTDTLRTGRVKVDYLDNLNSDVGVIHQTIEFVESQNQETYDELVSFFQLHLDIMNLIEAKADKERIAYISQKDIAIQLSTSPTNISNRLRQLIRYGGIEKVGSGAYKLINNSIWYTPYRIVHNVKALNLRSPELKSLYKEQAKVLNVSLNDISLAWSFIKMAQDKFVK